MKVSVGLFALFSLIPVIAGLTINTPTAVVQCRPTKFTWTGGTSPYYLSLLPAAQTAAPPLKTFPPQTGNEYSWLVSLGSGTAFTIQLRDNRGEIAYSDIVVIGPSSESGCLNPNVTETGGSSPAQTTSTTTRSTASASGTAAARTNAANHNYQSALAMGGYAGLIGLVAALF